MFSIVFLLIEWLRDLYRGRTNRNFLLWMADQAATPPTTPEGVVLDVDDDIPGI